MGLRAAAGGQRESARRRACTAYAQGRCVFKERPRSRRGAFRRRRSARCLRRTSRFAPLFANTALFARRAGGGDESQSGSLTAFERLCDNTLTAYFARRQSRSYSGSRSSSPISVRWKMKFQRPARPGKRPAGGAARRHDPRTAAGSVSMSEVSGTYKIAVLGERESVMGFAALGLAVFPVDSAEEAAEVFHRLTRQSDAYAIIYVTENVRPRRCTRRSRNTRPASPRQSFLIPGAGRLQRARHERAERRCRTRGRLEYSLNSILEYRKDSMKCRGRIVKVSGPALLLPRGWKTPNMADVVRVGKQQLIGEILDTDGRLGLHSGLMRKRAASAPAPRSRRPVCPSPSKLLGPVCSKIFTTVSSAP